MDRIEGLVVATLIIGTTILLTVVQLKEYDVETEREKTKQIEMELKRDSINLINNNLNN